MENNNQNSTPAPSVQSSTAEQATIASSPPVQTVVQEHHIPPVVMTLLLFFFAPLAIYFMYKDKKYYSWFFGLLLTTAIFSIVVNITMVILVIPQLTLLFSNLNTPYSPTLTYAGLWVVNLVSVGVIIFAFKLRTKLKTQPADSKKLVENAIFVMFANLTIATFAPMYLVFSPIYELISKIQ